ncbi:sugar transferase [Ellagibacter isourolithinifaciens]|uniref:sugar transferase n=1 Tax=Ellagibacter isourolithinifaciens TaxID=2137581 RepID=UPI003FD79947
MSVEDVMTPLAVSAANGGVEEPSAYTSVERREAADIDAVGKYEPKLTENGIPADVLAKLLPGDDVIELEMPVVGGNLAYRFVKRAFDVVSCSCALIILAIPMGVIALKIKSESPGPVIFAQRRVGKGGRIFNVYKFRSMYIDAEARGARWAQGDDPRVTPFGKVMRKTRMDEIPQFWNVVKGDIPLRILKTRPEFSEESMGAFALPAKSSTNKGKVFSQVVSCFASGLRMHRISGSNCKRVGSMGGQFLAKPVFKAVCA